MRINGNGVSCWVIGCSYALSVVARASAGAIAPRRRVGPEDYIGPVVVVSCRQCECVLCGIHVGNQISVMDKNQRPGLTETD